MIQLAIENSRECSVALHCNSGRFSLGQLDFHRDSDSAFLPCLTQFLNQHSLSIQDIQGWSVGLGPGSFAGIRFTLALVKGICTGTGAQARGVASGYAIAQASPAQGRIAVVHNARCGKIFVSLFKRDGLSCSPLDTPRLLPMTGPWPDSLLADFYCTADSELLDHLPIPLQLVPHAQALHLLDAPTQAYPWLTTPDLDPIYVRPPVDSTP